MVITIDEKVDLWYVGFGHLQFYRLLQDVYPSQNLTVYENNKVIPTSFILSQNYPNPFNLKQIFEFFPMKINL
tara:strand:+ start:403 stop:621 length:219 start_codon:yes stop_codon:yes gene_type:complete